LYFLLVPGRAMGKVTPEELARELRNIGPTSAKKLIDAGPLFQAHF